MNVEKKNRAIKLITKKIVNDPEIITAIEYDLQKLKIRTIFMLAKQMEIKIKEDPKSDFIQSVNEIIQMLDKIPQNKKEILDE